MPLCRSGCEVEWLLRRAPLHEALSVPTARSAVCTAGTRGAPAAGAREAERWPSQATARAVPCARVRLSRRVRATNPVCLARTLIGRIPEPWALIG